MSDSALAMDEFQAGMALFNAGRYRDALLRFERLWHHERSDLLRSLVLVSNALHQLQLGLVTAPRRNLARAAELLEGLPDSDYDLDLPDLRSRVAYIQAAIPAGLETGQGQVVWELVPRFLLAAPQAGHD